MLHWVFPGFSGFYWVLPGFIGLKPSFTRFNCFTGFYWVLLGFSVILNDFLHVTRSDQVSPIVTWFSWIIVGFTYFSGFFCRFSKFFFTWFHRFLALVESVLLGLICVEILTVFFIENFKKKGTAIFNKERRRFTKIRPSILLFKKKIKKKKGKRNETKRNGRPPAPGEDECRAAATTTAKRNDGRSR